MVQFHPLVQKAKGFEVGDRVVVKGDHSGGTWTLRSILLLGHAPDGERVYMAELLSEDDLDTWEEVELDSIRKL